VPIRCPVNGTEIFADAAMIALRERVPVSCVGCGGTHMWDPIKRRFAAEETPPAESSNSLVGRFIREARSVVSKIGKDPKGK
jgi:hypothetical protein